MAKLPDFRGWSDERIVEFWKTHTLDEFDEDLEEVEVKFTRKPKTILSIRMDKESIAKLKKIALEKGLAHSTLARLWITEKLKESAKAN